MSPALFQHDCTECRYLKRFDAHDLYLCCPRGQPRSIVARYGNEPSAYASAPISVLALDPGEFDRPLRVAMTAAMPLLTFEVHSASGLEGSFPKMEAARNYAAALAQIGANAGVACRLAPERN